MYACSTPPVIVTPAITPIDAIVRGDRDTQFNPKEIREIRRLRGEKTQDKTIHEFGTTQQMISRIQRRERYDWVDEALLRSYFSDTILSETTVRSRLRIDCRDSYQL